MCSACTLRRPQCALTTITTMLLRLVVLLLLSHHRLSFCQGHLRMKMSNSSSSVAYIRGDIVLGGLFPVHMTNDQFCDRISEDRGIQRLEAMLFTIDEINRRSDILPTLKLGAKILNTCSKEAYALEQTLEFVKSSISGSDGVLSNFYCADNSTPKKRSAVAAGSGGTGDEDTKIIGVVGGSYSSVSSQVANLLRLFNIPQISYASTSPKLSEKRNFPLFARTLPSDIQQAEAMAALIGHYNWSYVSTVYSSGDYGVSGIDAFWKAAEQKGICIALREVLPQNPTPETMREIVTKLDKLGHKARVVVLFVRQEHAKTLLDTVRITNTTHNLVWMASDGWGRDKVPVSNNSQVASGAITFELKSVEIAHFSDYFLRLRPHTNVRNPWFQEFWEDRFKCGANDPTTAPVCDMNRTLEKTFKQESKIQFVYDAVYAFAWAIHRLQLTHCHNVSGHQCIDILHAIDGRVLYESIINYTFIGKHGQEVRFNVLGDGVGYYNIYNYAMDDVSGQFDYRLVATYQNGQLNILKNIYWPGQTLEKPVSVCSKPCEVGQVKTYNNKDQKCCWLCNPCKEDEIALNVTACEKCIEGWGPNVFRNDCVPLEILYMRMSSGLAIGPMVLSGLGIAGTLFVLATFMRFSDTPIVRASGRELSYLLLSGCLLCYCMSFILLLKPQPVVCACQRVGIGLGFAVIYSSLLVKTNRIARIFHSATKSARRPAFISPKSQLFIAGLLIAIQLSCSIVWLLLSPPQTKLDFSSKSLPILRCSSDGSAFLVSLLYNFLLLLICTVYAVKTRKIPENFNESKFIGFAMYTTCVIWLAFIPIYYGTNNAFQVQVSTICVSVSLSATVTLCCLFTPKLYIIFLQPEKNVRKLTMSNKQTKRGDNSVTCSNNKENMEQEYSYYIMPVTTTCISDEMNSSCVMYNQMAGESGSGLDHPDGILSSGSDRLDVSMTSTSTKRLQASTVNFSRGLPLRLTGSPHMVSRV